MKTFMQYLESRRNNITVVQKAFEDLAIMLDSTDDEIEDKVEAMPFEELLKYVQEFHLHPASMDSLRFAAMMKMYCRGNV